MKPEENVEITKSRKGAHIDVCLKEKVEAVSKKTGFADVEFLHNAIPEMDFAKIDASCELLGKRLKLPLVIEAITGGFPRGGEINLALAQAAQENGIAFGLGSQRAMLEDASLVTTYNVRKVAPDVLVIGNIGAAQLAQYGPQKISKMVSDADLDVLAVHLNVLQELVQKEGDRNFEGCLKAIEKLCDSLSVPVIAKETGAGISLDVAIKLENAGVDAIDIAGAGGTSWSGVEVIRNGGWESDFWDWGIPTAVSVALVSRAVKIPVICSGGVRSGVDAAKGIALGASASGAALPFLKAWEKGGEREISSCIKTWGDDMKKVMMMTGSKNLSELKKAKLFVTGKTAEMLCAYGVYPNEFAKR